MAKVVFHTALADKAAYVARLVRKASRQGARLVVLCDQPDVFSQALWSASPVDFIAHATAKSDAQTFVMSSVILVSSLATQSRDMAQDVLVNASQTWPQEYARCSRVIELVGQASDEVLSGRERWKLYITSGIKPDKLG
jgi:DNA polymerase-3 subunit chi